MSARSMAGLVALVMLVALIGVLAGARIGEPPTRVVRTPAPAATTSTTAASTTTVTRPVVYDCEWLGEPYTSTWRCTQVDEVIG